MKRKLKRKFYLKLDAPLKRYKRHMAKTNERYYWGETALHQRLSIDTGLSHAKSGIIWASMFVSSHVRRSRIKHKKVKAIRIHPQHWNLFPGRSFSEDMVKTNYELMNVVIYEKKTEA